MKIETEKVKVFYSYSHKDEYLKDCFEAHMSGLRRKGYVEEWHDRKILPGQFWEESINSNIASADLVLFLVSSDFMASNYCYNVEVIKAVERHNNGLCTVVPIIIRECDWEGAPFESIQGLPTDMKPVISRHWHDQDEAFTNVVRGLKSIIRKIALRKTNSQINTATTGKPKDDWEIDVTFRNLYNGIERSATVHPGLTAKETIELLKEEGFIKETNEHYLRSKLLKKELEEGLTLMENNIVDGDTILVDIKTYAG